MHRHYSDCSVAKLFSALSLNALNSPNERSNLWSTRQPLGRNLG